MTTLKEKTKGVLKFVGKPMKKTMKPEQREKLKSSMRSFGNRVIDSTSFTKQWMSTYREARDQRRYGRSAELVPSSAPEPYVYASK
jgi:hypothetical protein